MTTTGITFRAHSNATRAKAKESARCRKLAVALAGPIAFVLPIGSPHADSPDQETVYLPCPSFSVGSSWSSIVTSPSSVESVQSTVVSRSGNSIQVGEKKTSKQRRLHPKAPEMPAMTFSTDKQYQLIESTVVQSHEKSAVHHLYFDPPMPICGSLPTVLNFASKIKTGDFTGTTYTVMKVRALGSEKVTVPAGTFDATVVEIRATTTSMSMPSGGMKLPDMTSRMYAVEGVGIVKVVSAVSLDTLVNVGAPDPEAEARIRQGLDRVAKGEDMAKVVAEMRSSSAPSGNAPKLKAVPTESEIVTELQNYHVPP